MKCVLLCVMNEQIESEINYKYFEKYLLIIKEARRPGKLKNCNYFLIMKMLKLLFCD